MEKGSTKDQDQPARCGNYGSLAVIYFITAENPEGYPIKIGFTKGVRPWERLESLQTACPYRLSVVGAIAGGWKGEEGKLHKRFSAYRLEGEWFERNDDLMDFIAKNKFTEAPPEKISSSEAYARLIAKAVAKSERLSEDREARAARARRLLSEGMPPHEVSKEVGISIKGVCKLRDKPMVKWAL